MASDFYIVEANHRFYVCSRNGQSISNYWDRNQADQTVKALQVMVDALITEAEQRGRTAAIEPLRAMRDRLTGRAEAYEDASGTPAQSFWAQVEILDEMIEVLELPPPRPVSDIDQT